MYIWGKGLVVTTQWDNGGIYLAHSNADGSLYFLMEHVFTLGFLDR